MNQGELQNISSKYLKSKMSEEDDIFFSDLFNIKDIQILQNQFSTATGVASIITEVDGTPITQPSNFTNLCQLIRKSKLGCANCYKSDAKIGIFNPNAPTIQPCLSGGLWDAGAAITVGGKHIANWLIGQVRDSTQSEEMIRNYAKEININEDKAALAFKQVPSMTYKQFEEISQVLFTLANQLSTIAYQNILQAKNIYKLKQTETEIRNFNTNLENIVKKRTIELEKSIDDLKETQSQLIQSEKMASLGNLVAGVAHEINTPISIGLTGITHFLEITEKLEKRYINDNMSQEDFEEYLDVSKSIAKQIHINLERTVNLVKSFKQVAVDQSSENKRTLNLKEYLNEILFSLKNIIKKTNIDIHIVCEDDIVFTSYPGAMYQIITNLILNSIKHGYKEKQKGIITISAIYQNKNLEIIYKDDGKGIKKEDLSKIFDPFFTTKRSSGGTGLGLNIVYNLVVNTFNGQIKCDSQEGNGVVFKINLLIE